MKSKNLSKYVTAEGIIKHILLYGFLLLLLLSSQISVRGSVVQTYTISGQLTDGFGHTLSNWSVTLRGAQTASTKTDMLGNYSFSNLQAGNYSVGPDSGGPNTLIFSRDVNNLNSDVTVNLTVLFFVNFQISVRDNSGQGIAAVGIRVSGGAVAFAQTNTFGVVNLAVNIPVTNDGPPATLTPEKAGYVFTPPTVTLSTQNGAQVVNFTGSISNSPLVQFGVSPIAVGEVNQRVNVTVTRTGDASSAASVDYATIDDAGSQPCGTINGIASPRCDYSNTIGTIQFAAGETSKSFSVAVIDDSYAEGTETFRVNLNNPQGASLGTLSTATVMIIDNDSVNGPNPIDTASLFVRQHYIDFLNREPDPSGLAFWTNEITSCGSDAQCIEVKRINVSAAFFLSIEFQQTGYVVETTYKTAFGDADGFSTFGGPHSLKVPIVRLNNFIRDTQRIGQGVIVGQGSWQQQLDDNKRAFMAEFVQRPEFIGAFPATMNDGQVLDKLNSNAGNPLSRADMDQMIRLGLPPRADLLRIVAERAGQLNSEFNRAFVFMQFVGYLRRNPNDGPDSDYSGYDFWLQKLNQFNGNYLNAEMVKAFIASAEYRQRFGP